VTPAGGNPLPVVIDGNGQLGTGTSGVGTITGVTAGTDLTGGGTLGNVTLNLDTTKVPTLGGNNFVGNQFFSASSSAGQVLTVEQTGSGTAAPAALFSGPATVLEADSTGGTAVLGYTAAAAGMAVEGSASSNASGSSASGVIGTTLSQTGSGVVGTNGNTVGTGAGIFGRSSSSMGPAGLFTNYAGGPIILGTNNGVQRLLVDGGGNLTASSLSGNGSGLTNVNAATLGGFTAGAFQPVGSYATLGANNFTGNQSVTGNLSSTGAVSAGAGIFSGSGQVDSAGLNGGTGTPGVVFGAGASGETISSNRTNSNGGTFQGLDLYTRSTPRLSITNSGSVGIGTQTPSATLNVVSSSYADGIDVAGFSGSQGTVGISVVGGNSSNFEGADGIDAYPGSGSAVLGPGWAGTFNGDVQVIGNLAKSGGGFKIDHPLDPANKYLYHSFVESPDMKNVYDGVVTLDGRGEAVVELPEWFETLNRDFRYQLTCIGGFAPVYIAEEVAGNRFKIAGGRAGMKISWQVTGIRQDPWANAHRIPVEIEKPDREQGYYLHPELYGAPEEKGVEWARHPEMMQRVKEMRAKAAQSHAK